MIKKVVLVGLLVLLMAALVFVGYFAWMFSYMDGSQGAAPVASATKRT